MGSGFFLPKIASKLLANCSRLTESGRGLLPLPIMCVQVECLCPVAVHAMIAVATLQAMVEEHSVLLAASCQRLTHVDWLILLDQLWIFLVSILCSSHILIHPSSTFFAPHLPEYFVGALHHSTGYHQHLLWVIGHHDLAIHRFHEFLHAFSHCFFVIHVTLVPLRCLIVRLL